MHSVAKLNAVRYVLVCFFYPINLQELLYTFFLHCQPFCRFLYTYFLCISRKVDISGFIRKIKLLASEKKMSIRQLEETLGFGNGVINRWRKNTPGSDKLKSCGLLQYICRLFTWTN